VPLSNSMKQNGPWEANSFTVAQEIKIEPKGSLSYSQESDKCSPCQSMLFIVAFTLSFFHVYLSEVLFPLGCLTKVLCAFPIFCLIFLQ
jgi:hypothetical protein